MLETEKKISESSSTLEKSQEEVSKKNNTLMGCFLLTVLLLLLTATALFAIYFKFEPIVRYGLVSYFSVLENKLEYIPDLSIEYKEELRKYLNASRDFVRENNVTRENILTCYKLTEKIKEILRDKQVDKNEMQDIRETVKEIKIPLLHNETEFLFEPSVISSKDYK